MGSLQINWAKTGEVGDSDVFMSQDINQYNVYV